MVEGPVTGRKFKRSTVRNATIAGACVIVLLVIVFASKFTVQNISEKVEQKSQNTLQVAATKAADTVADSIDATRKQLEALATDESVIALFKQANTEDGAAALKLAGEQKQVMFKSALKLRFLLPGLFETDREAKPPLSFASVNLLNRAEKSSKPVAVEMHSLGSEDIHIAMVNRVADAEGNAIGLLHLSMPLSVLESGISKFNIPETYIEIQQGQGSKAQILSKSGDAKFRKGDGISVNIKGTQWRAVSWNESSTATAVATASEPVEESSSMGMIILILLLVAAGAGGIVFYRRKQSTGKPKDEAETSVVYEGAVKAIMDGQHPGMEKLVPDLPQSGQSTVPGTVSQGLQGDDVTAVATPAAVMEAGVIAEEGVQATDAEQITPTPDSVGQEAVSQSENKTGKQAGNKPGSETAAPAQAPPANTESSAQLDLSPLIFRAYDIRGVVGETLSAAVVYEIGRAIGSEADARGQQSVVVGRDGRLSSPELGDALIEGLRAAGRDVIDIGVVPTPVLYFATHHLQTKSGVMLTGSHNGPEYNGLKIVLDGDTLSGDAIAKIRNRITENNLSTGQGELQTADINADYLRTITDDIPVALGGAFKLVVDCGNGVAGQLAPQLYKAMGHDVIELYCEIDGNFPNHHPDPSQPENMQPLIDKVKAEGADLGFAFDGDGDRLGIVDGQGNIIWPDRQMMLFARDVLSRNAGAAIIFDVKCSRYLKEIIETSGGTPLMWKTGHSLIKSKMKEVNAPLAGEMSGHIFFKERWFGFDDALYAGARALEILTNAKKSPAETFAELPDGIATPELRIPLAEKHHAKAMQIMKKKMAFEGAEVTDIDGLRVDFADGWGLVRPSNTSPFLIARFEAETQDALVRIQSDFRDLLLSVSADLKLPF